MNLQVGRSSSELVGTLEKEYMKVAADLREEVQAVENERDWKFGEHRREFQRKEGVVPLIWRCA